MKIFVKPLTGRTHCIVFPTGLLANSFSAGILWGVLNIAPLTVPYRLPKELVEALRKTTLPPGVPLVDILNQYGTQIRIEL